MRNYIILLASCVHLFLIETCLPIELFESSQPRLQRRSKSLPLYFVEGRLILNPEKSKLGESIPEESIPELQGRFSKLRSLFSSKKPKKKDHPVSSISRIVAENENEITLRIMCETMGGTIIGAECLEFVDIPSTFIDARKICRERGGDLFVPGKHEGFFFAKYFLYFRKAFKPSSRSLGWIGALRGGAGAPVLTIDGHDVTMDAIYNVYTITGSDCVHIYLDQGNAFPRGEKCSTLLPFTCEYVFDAQATQMIKERNFVVAALNYSNKKYARIFHDFPLITNK